MKKLIFSVWNDLTESHSSVPDSKLQAFHLYKKELIDRQTEYAKLCGADYEIFSSDKKTYPDTQFFKIAKCEEMSEVYDKVVYLDLDVIPKTNTNIFDYFNFGAYFIECKRNKYLSFDLENDSIHEMDMYSKMCCKNAMLLLHDIIGNNLVANTGVLIHNKGMELNFTEQLEEMHKTFLEACEDNLYPKEISNSWKPNNEVFYSYLIEKNKIPYDNIGLPWNFILDANYTEYSPAAHMIHQVNKDFKIGLQ